MIDISEDLEGILKGYSYQVYYRLQSWLNEKVIAEDIPAVDVVEEQDASLRVPERLTFTVPLEADGVSWVPIHFNSPLGCYGQRILAQIGVSVGSGLIEWLNRGVFLIESAETDANSIQVECLGLMQMLDEAELATEFQPITGATFGETLQQLVEPGITVDLTAAPASKVIPKSAVTWSDNRLDDIYTILEAWPAQARVTTGGVLSVTSVPEDPVAADVVYALTDGLNGTVIEYSGNITRDGAYNCVIAQGQYDDDRGTLAGLPIVHTALDVDPDSPYSLLGNFSPYLVPYKYDSPLLNEHTETLLAANTRLRNLRLKASRTVRVTAVPHPALQLGDAVSVTSRRLDLGGALGRVDAFRLPYGAEGGAMEITVRLQGLTSPAYTEAAAAAAASVSSSSIPTMPTTAPTGYTRVFAEDFNDGVGYPVGSFEAHDIGGIGTIDSDSPAYARYHSKLSFYFDGGTYPNAPATAQYYGSKTVSTDITESTANGLLNIHCHTESISGTPTAVSAWMRPITPIDVSQKLGYCHVSARMRIKDITNTSNYGGVMLLIGDTWPDEGEIDYPEGAFNERIGGFFHYADPLGGQDQFFVTPATYWDTWHIYETFWEPGHLTHKIDGTVVYSTTDRVPTAPQKFVFQCGVNTNAMPTSTAVADWQIDWIVIDDWN